MNPSLAFAIALAVSLAGNGWLYWANNGLREQIGQAKAQKQTAEDAAVACSSGVDKLQAKAAAQAKAAQKALAEARKSAIQAGSRADHERNRPQAVPGDECASAAAETREWLRERRGMQ